ncbi:hypothetical protein [Streptomyces sp. NRRL S-1868]|uniref:hypothetical protein n=1 Tax=Streptomyces sp. NRRL S-1868 TaxID=1463892 RepID=UPI0004CBDFD3|nr:hypothetical protein [Streptomyces sp. NRRL S-1868]
MSDDLIHRARAAQHHAARALSIHGLTGRSRQLLQHADHLARALWAAGYPVTALHQPTNSRKDTTS